jgi:hypothetical protein
MAWIWADPLLVNPVARNSTADAENTHLDGLICRPFSCRMVKNCLRWSNALPVCGWQ